MLEMLDMVHLPSCVVTNGAIFDYCPVLPAAFVARGDEIVAHGRPTASAKASSTRSPNRGS